MKRIKCCLGCENRHEACHGTCETYIGEKAEYERCKNVNKQVARAYKTAQTHTRMFRNTEALYERTKR